MADTLTRDYFVIMGVLSQTSEGLKLLELSKVFSYLYQLLELKSRDDIIKIIITSMYYGMYFSLI
jgi:Rapamycin-insensitive companion of mTOR, middle domain